MIPTPRVDRMAERFAKIEHFAGAVYADDARKLERELEAVRVWGAKCQEEMEKQSERANRLQAELNELRISADKQSNNTTTK